MELVQVQLFVRYTTEENRRTQGQSAKYKIEKELRANASELKASMYCLSFLIRNFSQPDSRAIMLR